MRIVEVHIDGFGAMRDRKIELGSGLVCVRGPNEAGKSTLTAFVRAVFFGFKNALSGSVEGDKRSRGSQFEPVHGGRKGGWVIVESQLGGTPVRYRIIRSPGTTQDGKLEVVDETNGATLQGDGAKQVVRRLLHDADETMFAQVFALGMDELHALDALGDQNVQAALFSADAGVALSLAGEMGALDQRIDDLHKKKGQKQVINVLAKRRRELEAEARVAERSLRTYGAERQRLQELQAQRAAALEAQNVVHLGADRAQKRQEVRVAQGSIRALQQQLPDDVDAARPDDAALEEAVRLETEVLNNQEALEGTQQEVARLEEKAAALTYREADADAWGHLQALDPDVVEQDAIDAERHARLREERAALPEPHVAAADRRVLETLDVEAKQHGRKAEEQRRRLASTADTVETAKQATLDPAVAETVERAARLDVDSVERRLLEARAQQQEAQGRRDDSLARLGGPWDAERVAAIDVSKETLIETMRGLPESVTALSTGATAPQGRSWMTVPVVGVVLLALGLVGLLTFLGPLGGAALAVAGLVLLAVTPLVRPSAQTGDAHAARFETAAETRRVLAAFGVHGDVSRGDFRSLVDLVGDAQGALLAVQRADAAVRAAAAESDQTRSRLRAALNAAGLEADPGDLHDLRAALVRRVEAHRTGLARLADLRRQHDEHRAELQATEAAQVELVRARRELLDRVKIPLDADVTALVAAAERRDRLGEQAENLAPAAARFEARWERFRAVQETRGLEAERARFTADLVEAQRACCAAAEARSAHVERTKRLEAECERLQVIARKQRSKVDRLNEAMARFGADSVETLRRAHDQRDAILEVRRKMTDLETRLTELDALAPGVVAEAQEVAPEDDERLVAGRSEALTQHKERFEQIDSAYRELEQRLAALDSSDRLGDLRSEIKAIEAEEEAHREEWAELMLTRFLLDKARAAYERDHGPKVLRRAGRFLERITDGRYTSIVRDTMDGSYVLERPGEGRVQAVPPHISRATYAQVYLCIRLAYTDVMETHQDLPYVLDDVFSDFDEARLKRAAEVVGELAQKRQVVLLTHHAHVAQTLEGAGASMVTLDTLP